MDEKLIILKELKQKLIENFGDNILLVILFGSQATGKATEFSDYDILIVLRDDYDWIMKRQVRNVCYDYEIDNQILLDIKIISLNELNFSIRGIHPIFTDTIKNGIYV
jgi:predicted nucleotidyltransferase